MNMETFNSALESRTLWIAVGIVAFFLWNNRKGSSKPETQSKNIEQAAKNDAKIKVTEDIESTDNDWVSAEPIVSNNSQSDAFSESVKQESNAYANNGSEGGSYKNGVDI